MYTYTYTNCMFISVYVLTLIARIPISVLRSGFAAWEFAKDLSLIQVLLQPLSGGLHFVVDLGTTKLLGPAEPNETFSLVFFPVENGSFFIGNPPEMMEIHGNPRFLNGKMIYKWWKIELSKPSTTFSNPQIEQLNLFLGLPYSHPPNGCCVILVIFGTTQSPPSIAAMAPRHLTPLLVIRSLDQSIPKSWWVSMKRK